MRKAGKKGEENFHLTRARWEKLFEKFPCLLSRLLTPLGQRAGKKKKAFTKKVTFPDARMNY
jgi:hypothetical protein